MGGRMLSQAEWGRSRYVLSRHVMVRNETPQPAQKIGGTGNDKQGARKDICYNIRVKSRKQSGPIPSHRSSNWKLLDSVGSP